jgi:hypothetical protein
LSELVLVFQIRDIPIANAVPIRRTTDLEIHKTRDNNGLSQIVWMITGLIVTSKSVVELERNKSI